MQLSSSASRHRYRDRLYFVAFLIFLTSGCGGGGCSCMAPLPNGFDPSLRQPNAAQARLTESGLGFVENNVAALAGSLLPGGTTIEIAPECNGGSGGTCCPDNHPMTCQIDLDLRQQSGDAPRAEIVPVAPNALNVTLRLRIKSRQQLVVKTGIGNTQCKVNLDTTASGNQSVTVTAKIDFVQDAATHGADTLGTTIVEMPAETLAINDIDNGDVSLSAYNGVGDAIVCGLANTDLLKGIVMGKVKDIFQSKVGGLISGQLCKKCSADSDCAPFATCGGGTCQVEGSNPQRCLQELGVTGRLAAGNLLSGLSPGQTGALDLYLVAGGYVKSGEAGGVSLGLLGGTTSADGVHNPCVPVVAPPAAAAIPESALLKGNTRPDGATFDLGVGISKQFLDRAGWSAFDSGFLCLNVGTRSVELLNTDTFANILIPSLQDLVPGQVSPIILSLRPQEPPTFTLGAGTFTDDGKIADPLLTLNMPKLEIDFYALVDQRFSRMFTVSTDVALGIGLQLNDQGQITPVLGSTDNAFTNVVVTNSDLLAETQQQIADKFPAVLSFAVPILTGSLKPIDLPVLAGMKLKLTPGGLTGIENNTMLGLFANLAPASKPEAPRVDTTAEIVRVETPSTETFSAPGRLDKAKRPRVELALGGDRPGLEWQVQVDDGPWSAPTRYPNLTLSQDGFWLQGRHKILVAARVAGHPETTDDTPVELTAVIDSIAPTASLTDQGDSILVEASDRVSPAEALVVDYRFGDGEWRHAGAPPVAIGVGPNDDPALFEARVADEAGNFVLTSGVEAGFHGRAPASSGCNCRIGSGGSSAPRGVWLVGALGFVGLVLARRRRAARARALPFAVLALATVVALGASACGSDAGGGGEETDAGVRPGLETGSIGRYLDMAAEGDRVVVVGYEDLYGDLVMGDVDSDGHFRLEPVDGVPAGAPVVDVPEGYRGGVAAPGENVGAYASVALVDGKARVAYQDLDDGTLLYGAEGDTWQRHVIDPADGGGWIGMYASLSVDASGVPGVAYLATAVPDGSGGFKSQLRWAQAATASPAASTDWSISVIAEGGIPCAGLCGDDTEFACVKSSNTCHMIESTCSAACGDGQACVSATCVDVVKAPVAEDLPDGPGLFASAARLPSGDPVVAFYDRTTGDLKLATFSAGTWTVSDLAVSPATDMGQWASLIVGGDGTLRVAFQDALADSLRYLEVSNGSVGNLETVDDGVRDDRPHPVGAGASLFFDAGGQLGLVYQDSATNDLLLARRDASNGTWTHTELMTGPIGYGFFNATAVRGGTTWVGTYGYDRNKFPPGKVVIQALP